MAAGDPAFADIEACVFDAYGTLFDFAAAAESCRDELGSDATALTMLWRDKQLAYTWLRAAQGRHADFWQVTGDALDFSLDVLGIDKPGLRHRLMALYMKLSPYPEVSVVLARLRRAGMRTAILSNGTPAMLAAAIGSAGIGKLIGETISVEEVGVFKPHQAVYQQAVDRLGVSAGAICFVSSNGWDIHAGAAFGFRTVWCNRAGQPRERLPGVPDEEIETLTDLLAVLNLS